MFYVYISFALSAMYFAIYIHISVRTSHFLHVTCYLQLYPATSLETSR